MFFSFNLFHRMETVECLEDIRLVIQRGPGRFPNTHTVAPQGLAYILIPLFANQPTDPKTRTNTNANTNTHSHPRDLHIYWFHYLPTNPKTKTRTNANTNTQWLAKTLPIFHYLPTNQPKDKDKYKRKDEHKHTVAPLCLAYMWENFYIFGGKVVRFCPWRKIEKYHVCISSESYNLQGHLSVFMSFHMRQSQRYWCST